MTIDNKPNLSYPQTETYKAQQRAGSAKTNGAMGHAAVNAGPMAAYKQSAQAAANGITLYDRKTGLSNTQSQKIQQSR